MKQADLLNTIQVEVVDARDLIFSGPCRYLIAPAALGELCIMPRHAPLITKLVPGELRFSNESGEEDFMYTSGGFLEVQADVVTVLADCTLRAEQLDATAALSAKHAAELALSQNPLFEERGYARLELAQATAKLKVLAHLNATTKLRGHGRH